MYTPPNLYLDNSMRSLLVNVKWTGSLLVVGFLLDSLDEV